MEDMKAKLSRSVSNLKLEGAEQYPAGPLLAFLITIMVLDGADSALFPMVAKALERTVDFDIKLIGQQSTTEGFIKAFFGPIWGVMAARKYMERKTILAVMTFTQGLATLLMRFAVNNVYFMIGLRMINGACLAGLLPVAMSVVADRFDDEVRGRMFALLNMSRIIGSTAFGTLYSITSEWCFNPSMSACPVPDSATCSGEKDDCSCKGLFGWEYSFILSGLIIMAFAPLVYFYMTPPPVTPKNLSDNENIIVSEIKALGVLLWNTPTFAILVIQGCFGGLPWMALQFRAFFFETAGLNKEEVTTVFLVIGFVSIFGGGFSGWLSDTLNKIYPMHGRLINAEFSVYGGVPFAFLTFYQPWHPSSNIFVYFLTVSILMHAICGGVGGGTNAPILSQLARPDERALIIAWQASLELSIASFGPVIFTTLAAAFNYRAECNPGCNRPDYCGTVDDNTAAAGNALVFTSSVPWVICGMLYTSLHWIYPKDMARILDEQEREAAGITQELTPAAQS